MIKMYNAEVLSKFPVVQHFPFGSLFRWDPDPEAVRPPESVHTSNQPRRDDTASRSRNSAIMRSPLQDSTKAPWADPRLGNINQMGETQAPRMTRRQAPLISTNPRIASHVLASIQKPLSTVGIDDCADAKPHTISSAQPSRAENGKNSDGQSMPPPTKAPWAK